MATLNMIDSGKPLRATGHIASTLTEPDIVLRLAEELQFVYFDDHKNLALWDPSERCRAR